jgi:hypothetical protein
MVRCFNVGDTAHLSRNLRGRGFMLKLYEPVTVKGYHKINDAHGGWLYDIEVVHPKTKVVVILEKWVTQSDLVHPETWTELQRLRREVGRT